MSELYIAVEYVASGTGHLDRLPCLISIKHGETATIKKFIVNWGERMISPLTNLTHLTQETIVTHGISFMAAIAMVRAEMSPDTVIVGMNANRHVRALQLCKNVHYSTYVDLTSRLKIKQGARWHFIPIRAMAKVLDIDQQEPIDDLDMVQRVYTLYRNAHHPSVVTDRLTEHVRTQPTQRNANQIFSIDGVCTSAYNERQCSCKQMSLNPHPSNRPKKQGASNDQRGASSLVEIKA
jgi:hypothetical protein